MKVTMLLADAAQAIGGKLYILGGGWSVTGPHPTAAAIAPQIEGPWDEANRPPRPPPRAEPFDPWTIRKSPPSAREPRGAFVLALTPLSGSAGLAGGQGVSRARARPAWR